MKYPEHLWFRKRGYLHFDKPISLEHALNIVTNPYTVATHSFLPFITFTSSTYKIQKDKGTNSINKMLKERPIAYSSHIDSHIYSYYASILDELYENELQTYNITKNILAFRALNKSNIEFAHEAFQEIKKIGSCSAVALDLSKFFDTLNHNLLKDAWCKLLRKDKLPEDHYAVFKAITKYSKVDKEKLYDLMSIPKNNTKNTKKTRKQICSFVDFRNKVRKSNLIIPNKSALGIPQGSPISALLSNIYMLNFDIEINEYISSLGGKYFRYCDDMLFIVPTHEKNNIAGEAEKRLNKLKVHLNTKKTEIREFSFTSTKIKCDKPLQYLGFIFDGENIFLRSSSLSRYSDRMKRGVRLAKATMIRKNKIRKYKGLSTKELFKEKIYARYAHVGKRNFLTYGYRASRIMNSNSIRKQLKPLWERLQKEINK
ncbi:antiviral reverse transcriptase Drt2 [Providencia alcalifaciens]|uniref:antiviral reverse transcriptase Drt2 n=1 Tax=Providencia alcalifaciens TaxID=126385 RepID=UPI000563F8E7|nr:antiviral reverse transcriptase Drt2 [Providencia alcalifaciens]